MPYRLFALSNFASMLALLSYPLLIEPNLPSRRRASSGPRASCVSPLLCGADGVADCAPGR